jgi:hypothetical protein
VQQLRTLLVVRLTLTVEGRLQRKCGDALQSKAAASAANDVQGGASSYTRADDTRSDKEVEPRRAQARSIVLSFNTVHIE